MSWHVACCSSVAMSVFRRNDLAVSAVCVTPATVTASTLGLSELPEGDALNNDNSCRVSRAE
jgi:hypothetical protein